jgi:hypothetical protein
MLRGGEQLSELQLHMGKIYGVANSELSIEAILARLLEAVSETSSPFEMSDNHSIFVKALSWYFAFCNRTSIDVQACMIRRYPQLCPLCVAEVCVCERTNRLPIRASYLAGNRDDTLRARADRLLHKQKIERKKTPPFDINWFAHILSDIYPVNRARWRVNRFYFPAKLLRETGKLANGFRKYRNAGNSAVEEGAKRRLEDDAADFFAWLLGYWGLVASELRDDDLQSNFSETYKLGCPYCDKIPCGCPRERRLGNRAEFVSFNLLNESPDLARELEKRLAEVIRSLEPHPELAKAYGPELEKEVASGLDPRKTLSKIAESASKLDATTGSAENIARRISNAVELIERSISFLG